MATLSNFDKKALLQHLAVEGCDVHRTGAFKLRVSLGSVTCNKHSVQEALESLDAALSTVAGHVRYKPTSGELLIPMSPLFSEAHRLAAASFFEFARYKVALDDQ